MINARTANSRPRHVVTGVVRLAFCNLTSPKSRHGREARYSTTVLIDKTDETTLARVHAAIEEAARVGAAKLWGGRPGTVDSPIRDGDGLRPETNGPFGHECGGHFVFTASAKRAPGIVDARRDPIKDPSEIYSGMYARVSIDFFPYARDGKTGVGAALVNVQKVRDGQPFAGRPSARDDFDDEPAQA